jgi:hypothetical protein
VILGNEAGGCNAVWSPGDQCVHAFSKRTDRQLLFTPDQCCKAQTSDHYCSRPQCFRNQKSNLQRNFKSMKLFRDDDTCCRVSLSPGPPVFKFLAKTTGPGADKLGLKLNSITVCVTLSNLTLSLLLLAIVSVNSNPDLLNFHEVKEHTHRIATYTS